MKVVIADKVDRYLIDKLTENGIEVDDLSLEKEKLVEHLGDADGLIIRSATKVTKDLIEKAPKLQVIGRPGVGLDNVDLHACKEKGITVFNSPEAPSRSVAEFTLGLIIASARNFGSAYLGTREGKWPKKASIGTELLGKTLGVIGTGAIGKLVCKFGIALGMKIVAFDIVKDPELEKETDFRYVDIETLYSTADIITVHVPLLPQTNHMINQETIAKMKDGVILINAARGGIIDEDALLDALESGKISCAALDVFEKEPLEKSKLSQHPRVIVTPHIGANTREAQFNNGKIIAEKIISFFLNKEN